MLKLYSRKCNSIIKRITLDLWTEGIGFLYQAVLFVSDPDNRTQATDSGVLSSSHSTVSLFRSYYQYQSADLSYNPGFYDY